MKNAKKYTTRFEKSITSSSERKIRSIVKNSYPLKNDIFMLFAQHKEFCQEFLRVILQKKEG